jgi:NitT/TauT family transport system substrate-binding protein
VRRRIFLTSAGALALTACGSDGDGGKHATAGSGAKGPEISSVKVGVIPIVDVAPVYLGVKKGFFKAEGLTLKLVTAQGGAAIVPGVVSGDFHFGFSNVTSLLLAQSSGIQLQAVTNGVNSTGKDGKDFGGVYVRKGSGIRTAADLEGHTCAVNTLKNINDTTVRESVRKADGDPSKVKFLELAFPDMPAALESGKVDAVQIVEPGAAQVRSRGARLIASNYVDTAPGLTVALYFTGKKFAEANPGTVAAFTAGTKKSLAYAQAHPDEARQAITGYTSISAKLLPEMVLPAWDAEPDRASIKKLADLGQKDRIFSKAPDADALFS